MILIGLGTLFGLPISLFTGIYLAEHKHGAFASVVRFLTDVLSGIPSIVVGVVAYMLVVLPMKGFSALAGGVALGILMIPTATRTTKRCCFLFLNLFESRSGTRYCTLESDAESDSSYCAERYHDRNTSCACPCGGRNCSSAFYCIGESFLVHRHRPSHCSSQRVYL